MLSFDNIEIAIRKVYQYAEPNLTIVGWMGFLGFPAYYIVWQFFFPQPYENLTLRLIGSLLFLGLIFRNKIKIKYQYYTCLYYHLVVTFGLPFFFFYMLLMNDYSMVWIMSLMAAIFLHILLTHITWIMIFQTLIGLSLATFCAWLNNGFHLNSSMNLTYLPIFLFIYLFGNFFYSRNQISHETNITIAKAFGAGIAHEMRNPLNALYSSIDIIQSVIPNKKIKDGKSHQLSEKDLYLLNDVIINAIESISSGNETIDLLLTSIDENRVARTTFKKYNALNIIKNSIKSFTYKSTNDRQLITVIEQGNFDFLGSDTLLRYLLFNLFKNAYRFRISNDFQIKVIIEQKKGRNLIHVQDNGPGIDPSTINRIFDNFYTTSSSKNYGLGLPFCKKVMLSFGGDIECRSEAGNGTQFTMSFPLVYSKKYNEITEELRLNKSILFVSDQEYLHHHIYELKNKMDFILSIISCDKMMQKIEYDFEYDLIYIDIESFIKNNISLHKIRELLIFTEASIVYLYQSNIAQKITSPPSSIISMTIETWLINSKSVMNNMLFYHFDLDLNYKKNQISHLKHVNQCIIMIVDDSKSLRHLTANILEKQGFKIIQCENGVEAIDILNQQIPNLILMDIEMPIMGGIETTEKIRDSKQPYNKIPIIAHTGDSSLEALKKIKASGISDIIIKPASKDKLVNKINQWI